MDLMHHGLYLHINQYIAIESSHSIRNNNTCNVNIERNYFKQPTKKYVNISVGIKESYKLSEC